MLSNCCNAKMLKAISQTSWIINGKLAHQWYECTSCKQTVDCDIINQLTTEKEADNDKSDSI